ncbi:MAG: 16S rRNA (cytosine(1402)-N(4))-methyltransferase RsmH [Nocardioidaceae bacterium]|nr:16S rRNA (cytosine(1402)-N(4))-methyltransferase RsmH [Nocardioidaceae bacterium]
MPGTEPTPASTPSSHQPVQTARVVELLAPVLAHPNAVLVDATVGLGGHAEAVLDRCPQARVIGLDRDPEALSIARERLARFTDRVVLVRTVYDSVADVVDDHGDRRRTSGGSKQARVGVDAVLFDLGVSSLQLDRVERGFAYSHDAPLDMRMTAGAGGTAADLLNSADERELATILRRYGEERFATKIATAVVRARAREPFTTSGRLVEVVRAAVPAATRRTGGHPAKRTFQALRIAVNDELAALRRALPAAIDVTFVHGRIVALSYHSLEDRIVKRELVTRSRAAVPDDLPFIPAGRGPELRLLTRGAERAAAEEVAANPRARSVRLRAAERLREVA